ncbi:hypothetical protein FISHEDRAFT_74763 [Fistulina hepatica ATCC 64428]|uniref:Uncharacterized protein n=1 Tax=Fistulina hepatica ATCC 64428 TaxID=1128425 RepID=A0A0D7AA92_9AGAR|nr:hypothetical protein FISHEDRAFT_74763 [Fistulina hepatica ATCC 64428]
MSNRPLHAEAAMPHVSRSRALQAFDTAPAITQNSKFKSHPPMKNPVVLHIKALTAMFREKEGTDWLESLKGSCELHTLMRSYIETAADLRRQMNADPADPDKFDVERFKRVVDCMNTHADDPCDRELVALRELDYVMFYQCAWKQLVEWMQEGQPCTRRALDIWSIPWPVLSSSAATDPSPPSKFSTMAFIQSPDDITREGVKAFLEHPQRQGNLRLRCLEDLARAELPRFEQSNIRLCIFPFLPADKHCCAIECAYKVRAILKEFLPQHPESM